MMGGMRDMSNLMSATMGKMSGMMKDMPAGNMKNMSRAMSSGKVSAKDMKKMQDRMIEIEKEMSGWRCTNSE